MYSHVQSYFWNIHFDNFLPYLPRTQIKPLPLSSLKKFYEDFSFSHVVTCSHPLWTLSMCMVPALCKCINTFQSSTIRIQNKFSDFLVTDIDVLSIWNITKIGEKTLKTENSYFHHFQTNFPGIAWMWFEFPTAVKVLVVVF